MPARKQLLHRAPAQVPGRSHHQGRHGADTTRYPTARQTELLAFPREAPNARDPVLLLYGSDRILENALTGLESSMRAALLAHSFFIALASAALAIERPPREERMAQCKADVGTGKTACYPTLKTFGPKKLPTNIHYGWYVGKG